MTSMFLMSEELRGVAQLDTSNVTVMNYMFSSCRKLEDVPMFDTHNVTDMNNMFQYCVSLTDKSLNNILLMCANSQSATKTLKHIGLTSAQATKCTTLSNYTTFTNAGWSTGY